MKKVYLTLILSLMILGLSACSSTDVSNDLSKKNMTNNSSAEDSASNETKSITDLTLADITKHNIATDCWLLIDSKVYDVTPFIASGNHPGGDKILNGCGNDATIMYKSNENHNKASAPLNLAKYLIGSLK